MKKEMTMGMATGIYNLLSGAKYGQLGADGIVAVVDLLAALQGTVDNIENYRKTLSEQFSKDHADGDTSWVAAAEAAMKKKAEEKVKLDLPALTKQQILTISAANDWVFAVVKDLLRDLTDEEAASEQQ